MPGPHQPLVVAAAYAAAAAFVAVVATAYVVVVAAAFGAAAFGAFGAAALSTLIVSRNGASISRIFRRLRGRARSRGAGCQVLRAGLPPGAAGQAMRLAAQLMPPDVGRRWLAEADSFLSEAPPEQRDAAICDYLATAPEVIAAGWGGELARRARRATAGHGDGEDRVRR